MNTYTLDEVRLLAQIFNDNADLSHLSQEEADIWHSTVNYPGMLEEVIVEKISPQAILMEFLGAYENLVNNEETRLILHEFLFSTPLSDMPLHINDKDTSYWKHKIALWRLKIDR
jgi:hypothetical protein